MLRIFWDYRSASHLQHSILNPFCSIRALLFFAVATPWELERGIRSAFREIQRQAEASHHEPTHALAARRERGRGESIDAADFCARTAVAKHQDNRFDHDHDGDG